MQSHSKFVKLSFDVYLCFGSVVYLLIVCLFVFSCDSVIFQSYVCHLYITFCFYLVQNKPFRVPCIIFTVFVGHVPIRK